jgi:protein TonB
VSAEGRTQHMQVEQSSGSSRLDMAAQTAVRDWRFVPAHEGGVAVAGWVTVPINWKLEN